MTCIRRLLLTIFMVATSALWVGCGHTSSSASSDSDASPNGNLGSLISCGVTSSFVGLEESIPLQMKTVDLNEQIQFIHAYDIKTAKVFWSEMPQESADKLRRWILTGYAALPQSSSLRRRGAGFYFELFAQGLIRYKKKPKPDGQLYLTQVTHPPKGSETNQIFTLSIQLNGDATEPNPTGSSVVTLCP